MTTARVRTLPPMAGRRKAEQPYLDAAARLDATRAEQLIEGIENLTRKYRDLSNVPLPLIDRCERALVQTHAHNLLRLPEYPRLDEEGVL